MRTYFLGDEVYFNHRGKRRHGVIVRATADAITIEYTEPRCRWYEFVRIRRDEAAGPRYDVALAGNESRCALCGEDMALIGAEYYCLRCQDSRESEEAP